MKYYFYCIIGILGIVVLAFDMVTAPEGIGKSIIEVLGILMSYALVHDSVRNIVQAKQAL